MKKVMSLFVGAAKRQGAVDKRITGAEKRYSWWFDNPLDWEQPVRTLYITGWCVNRRAKNIQGIRARVGRRRVCGNDGIQRKDVAAVLGPVAGGRRGCGLAGRLAVGKWRGRKEVQEA